MSERWKRSKIAQSGISLIVPAHNVAGEVEVVVTGWYRQLDRRGKPFEVLVVDDGSTDATPDSLKALASTCPRLRVLHHDTRQGLGAALRQGIAAAQHPLVLTTSCDEQYRPEDLGLLLGQIDNVDIVLAVRQAPPMPPLLRGLGWVYRALARVLVGVQLAPRPAWHGWAACRRRWLARRLFGLTVTDPECPLRLYRRSIFGRIPIQSDGPFALYEIVAKANFLGCIFTEVPTANRPAAAKAEDASAWAGAAAVFQRPDFGPAVVKSFSL